MITVFRSNQLHAVSDLKIQARRQLEPLPRMIASIGTSETIYRFEYDCEQIDLLAWLHNQRFEEKMYWSDRDGSFEMAGILSADTINGHGPYEFQNVFEQAQQKLSADDKNLRYYGGFCFNVNSMNEDWNLYGSYRLVVPRFEINRKDQAYIFAVNIHIRDINPEKIGKILQELEQIDFSLGTQYRAVPKILSREDKPSFNEWNKIFPNIVNGPCEKIVLARKTDFDFNVHIRPSALIKFLKVQTPNCYHFCFQIDADHGFLGATPERLLKMVDDKLYTEAVAGTTPKGDSVDEIRQQEEKLLLDEKIQREHNVVVDSIKRSLQKFCSQFQGDSRPALLKLENGQHLITRFEGTVKGNYCADDVLNELHPTPAVAGYPREEAMKAVIQNEPFARGWYAGPVGYIGYNESEFVVAIRSGLIDKNRLSLFAGAGIVKGSCAQEEWDEIENKISRFMKVFDQ